MCDRKDSHRRGKGKVTAHTTEGDWHASGAECLGQCAHSPTWRHGQDRRAPSSSKINRPGQLRTSPVAVPGVWAGHLEGQVHSFHKQPGRWCIAHRFPKALTKACEVEKEAVKAVQYHTRTISAAYPSFLGSPPRTFEMWLRN